MTSYVMTGLARLDRPHRDLERCIRGLAEAVRARDLSDARRQTCLLVEKLAEHFADEEEIMRATGWPLLDRHAECHELLLFQARPATSAYDTYKEPSKSNINGTMPLRVGFRWNVQTSAFQTNLSLTLPLQEHSQGRFIRQRRLLFSA